MKILPIIAYFITLALCSQCSQPNTSTTGSNPTGSGIDTECEKISAANLNLALVDPEVPFIQNSYQHIAEKLPKNIKAKALLDSYEKKEGHEQIKFDFYMNEIPLCQYEAHTHMIHNKILLMGLIPTSVNNIDAELYWSSSEALINPILDKINMNGEAKIISQKKCIVIDEKALKPAWEFHFRMGTLPFYGLSYGKEVYEAEPRYFTLTDGRARIYKKSADNPSTATLEWFDLKNISSGGSLCHERFVTDIPSSKTKAFSTSSIFNYGTEDDRFNETSVFTNALDHSIWFTQLEAAEGQWIGPQIQLVLMEEREGEGYLNDIAVYEPPTANLPPVIKLGNGKDIDLKNLHFDADVISHELGHHIVYRYLTTVKGDAAVMHEGLTDYFVQARTGDPCLGELICPKGSSLCNNVQCLRSADNNIVYEGENWPTGFHKQSQFISGLLWDIGKEIGQIKTANITFKGVTFLTKSSGYAELIQGLISADSLLYGGSNCSIIVSQAQSRGLTNILSAKNINCNN